MEFQGNYVADAKNVFLASAVSGQNAVFVGPPGWGKTHMAQIAARAIAAIEGVIFLEFDPSTPPEVVKGSYNPAALLDGRLERVFTDTPYDPRGKIVICDELFRTSDIVFDAFLHVTESKTRPPLSMPVFWATANHVAEYERVEALRDRFAFWFYLIVDKPDIKEIVKGHLSNGSDSPHWSSEFPKWEECLDIRRIIPGKAQVAMIADFINTLAREAYNCDFDINPRRLVQWSEILFRYSAFLNGKAEFSAIPKKAMAILAYAYPNVNLEKATTWKRAVTALVDKEGAALVEVVENLRVRLEQIVNAKRTESRENFNQEIGQFISMAQKSLEQFSSDSRASDLIEKLMGWYAQMTLGINSGLDWLKVEL